MPIERKWRKTRKEITKQNKKPSLPRKRGQHAGLRSLNFTHQASLSSNSWPSPAASGHSPCLSWVAVRSGPLLRPLMSASSSSLSHVDALELVKTWSTFAGALACLYPDVWQDIGIVSSHNMIYLHWCLYDSLSPALVGGSLCQLMPVDITTNTYTHMVYMSQGNWYLWTKK